MTSFSVKSSGDASIEVAVQSPPDPAGTIVVCHPHPSHGGSMTHPIIKAIANEAVAQGLTSIRFNFRGVGGSKGRFTGGPGEIDDLSSVMAHVASDLPPATGVAGWSFGAAIALMWQSIASSAIPYVGIAPPVRWPGGIALPPAESLVAAEREFIIGDRDQFVDVEDLTRYAATVNASVNLYARTDHFFINKYERLAQDVLKAISR